MMTTKIIPGMEKKCSAIGIHRGYTLERALISLHGPDEALRDSGYFNYYVTVEDIIPGY
ncbi:MAG TPA: hypothetical protein VK469_07435 [Candidatus Kapabacteria bacterium]|nr:hypothetical protein [Candidatus Kapabacteria bacterium]